MKIRLGKALIGTAALAVITLGAAWIATVIQRRGEIDTVSGEQKLARTLSILRTGTPTHPNVLKVLFYGQSIMKSGWDKEVVKHWHQTYPNTVFVVKNLAIGGFAAQLLEGATKRDIASFYPDLIVFHVYGDHRAYEQIVRDFRSQTAADILVQTDHAVEALNPPCSDGLSWSLKPPPGCKGILWSREIVWSDEMSYHKIPAFAKKYGLAVEPQRTWWREYLLQTQDDPRSLLSDDVHPNDKGRALMATFFDRYFDNLVQHWNGETEHLATSHPPPASQTQQISFSGNRIELISAKPLTSPPSVTVDGRASKDIDGCYLPSRASGLANPRDWPALRQIVLVHDHTQEDWTATVTEISPDQESFSFRVLGSVSGDQGTGEVGKGFFARPFVSRSGQLRIEPKYWTFLQSFQTFRVPTKAPFEVHWSVDYLCGNQPEVIEIQRGITQYRYTLATGLPNAAHALSIDLAAADMASVIELRSYQPPLTSN